MEPFPVGEYQYICAKLPARKQFHVVRRLGPILAKLVAKMQAEGMDLSKMSKSEDMDDNQIIGVVLPALTDGFAAMTDADADFVLTTCLAVCKRQDKTSQMWTAITTPDGQLMYDDIDLSQMLNLVLRVVGDNLTAFFTMMQANRSP